MPAHERKNLSGDQSQHPTRADADGMARRASRRRTAVADRPGWVALVAASSALSVANVYYAQPLLGHLAREFGFSEAAAGAVITATQVGCGMALLALVPLGDVIERRRLLQWQCLALVAALLGVAFAPAAGALLAGMLLVGMLGTAMTQSLIAHAATVASAAQRGRIVGAAQGGVVVGLLLARVLSGAIAEAAGWRAVYLAAAGAMALAGWQLRQRLPSPAAMPASLPYPALLRSMLALLRHDRVLHTRGVLGMLIFAMLGTLWSAMALMLAGPPYRYGTTAIGLFGLVGAAGAMGAYRAGAWTDRGHGQRVTGLALTVAALAWWPLALGGDRLWALLAGVVLLDLGAQAVHVVNQSLVIHGRTDAAGRLVGCYMLFYAAGSGFGAIAATQVHAIAGWGGVCLLGASLAVGGLAFWRLTLHGGAAAGQREPT